MSNFPTISPTQKLVCSSTFIGQAYVIGHLSKRILYCSVGLNKEGLTLTFTSPLREFVVGLIDEFAVNHCRRGDLAITDLQI
jgi:hypothetical protein